jgi:dienelactone hydrolase
MVGARPPKATLVEYAPERRGFLYHPEGPGPFPVVVWNHGAEQLPGWRPELAQFYLAHGWAFFVPHRSGHGRSPGAWIGKEYGAAKQLALQDEHNADVVSAIAWIKQQPRIDPARVVVSGCSFGGIQTLIVAAKDVGIRAAVPFAPAAMRWRIDPGLRDRLVRAAREAKVPVFLIQAENDYDLSPSHVIGAELEKLDAKHNRVHVYPATGTSAQDGHGFCVTGTDVWGPDVLGFLDEATKPAATPAKPAATPATPAAKR